MAGQKLVQGVTKCTDPIGVGGLPLVTIIDNGHIQKGDEWALFRLTDDGLSYYRMGYEFASEIMFLKISGKRAVVELTPRYQTEAEALQAREKLSVLEQKRTLIRSVRPL
jgi:hypothetical protein